MVVVPEEVRISTGSRLHFGLLSCKPAQGRQFGGAGLMIDRPGFCLRIRPAENDAVVGLEEAGRRVSTFLKTYRDRSSPEQRPGPCHIEVQAAIPPHVGLGSGTQLGLAVARALALLSDDDRADAPTLARRVGRGARSAVGIHGFERGGFLVEAGKGESNAIGTLVARADFPDAWRFLLVLPPGEPGLSGSVERNAFEQLPPTPASTTDRLCRLALLDLLPAVNEADFAACSAALFEFGRTVGDYFAPVQGGTYAHPAMRRLVEHLDRQGIRGVGQTSWGPTLFVLLPDQRHAEQLMTDLSADTRWSDCRVHIARPLNRGAIIGDEMMR